MKSLESGNRGDANLETMTEDLLTSSEIEGVILNPQSVKSSFARRLGLDFDGNTYIQDHYVEGLVDIMIDATSNNSKQLTEDRLFGWHAALFPTGRSGMYKIKSGGWREGAEPMLVVSGAMGKEHVHYEAPPSECVQNEMTRLINWCNNDVNSPFIKAAVAQLWFLSIHPFDDGNGRIGRVLSDMFLSQAANGAPRYYSLSAEINRSKKSYYEILEKTQKGDMDITDWILWFFHCVKRAVERSLLALEITIQKTTFWEKNRSLEINERQRKVINMLWGNFEGKLTSSKWAKICGCSQDTALRDINDLISKRILCNTGETGRNTSYRLV